MMTDEMGAYKKRDIVTFHREDLCPYDGVFRFVGTFLCLAIVTIPLSMG